MDNKKEKELQEESREGLNSGQKILTLTVIILWLLIFLGGILVNSKPYRDVVSNHSFTAIVPDTSHTALASDDADIYVAWLIVILFYTPTNLAFLCMVAGLLGALARIAKLHVRDKNEPELPSDHTNPMMSGVLRGVFVYLLIFSGILLIDEAPFIAPTQIQYIRLAGFLSLLSFMLSYNPSRFRSFLARSLDHLEGRIGAKK